MQTVTKPNRKFIGLEVGRGVAAGMVALHHAGIFVRQLDSGHIDPLGGVTDDFHVGIDFFFVLSGFLITWLHWSDIGDVSRLKGYLLRRFSRVYPVYWCILLPLIAGNILEHRATIWHIVASILLIPTDQQPILGVGWTLVYEIFFYLGFGAIILGGRRMIWALPLWAVAILVHYAVAGLGPFPTSFFLSTFDLEFMTGIAAALILRNTTIPYPGWVLAFGLLIFFSGTFFRVGTMLPIMSPQLRMIFGFSAGLIVLGIVELDRSNRSYYPSWVVLFGTASYSVYLVHSFVEFRLAKLLRPLANHLSPDLTVVVVAAFGIASGILFHVLIERRITAWVNAAIFPHRKKRLPLQDASMRTIEFAKEDGRPTQTAD